MTFPTLGLDFSPTTDPFDTPSWSSIVSKAHKLTISTGRSNELEPFQPGSIRVRLDNHDRTFDPQYSSGTYYPNLKPGKRIRVQATHSATTYDLFTGFVDGWPQNYQPPASAFADITATDGMKWLARSINIDPYGAVIQTEPDLFAWYRFDEAAGSVYSDSSGNGYHAAAPAAAPCADNAVDALTSSGKNAIQCTPAEPITFPQAASFNANEGAVEFWVRMEADAAFPYTPGDVTGGLGYVQPPSLINWDQGGYPAPTYYQLSVYIDNGALFGYGNIVGSAGGMFYRSTEVNWLDGLKHHILLYRNADTIKILVDGADRFLELPYGGGSVDFVKAPLELNSPSLAGDQWANPPIIDELAFYNELSDTPEAIAIAHNEAGRRPFIGDLPGARVTRILDLAGWPASERDIDDGISPLGAASWDASTPALSLLDEIERTELGGFYIDHANAGVAKFRQRTALYTDTRSITSQATISDDPAETLHYSKIDGSFDEQTTVNKVTVRWVGGDVVALDQTSIDAVGENSISISTILPTYEAATYYADGILLRYGTPLAKFASITLEPSASQILFTECLSRRIGDRITVERTPQGVGSAIAFDCIVEGIDHVIDNGVNVWTTTYHLSRADPEAYWILDTSALETTAVLAF